MATRKDYTLIGIGSDVQFGKGGGRFVWNTDHFESTSDGTTLAQLRVPLLPVDPSDAASKDYVDNIAAGLDVKESVRASTTAAGALASDFENGDTIDGVTLATGDRILIKDQASSIENGIYEVQATGAPVRTTDADATNELSGGTFVFVEEGTANADTGWVISSNGPITPGTDANDWTQFSGAGVITAGIGLTQAATVFNVNVGATTVAVDGGDDLIVNSSATAGQTLISAGTVGTEATWGALDLSNANATVNLLPKNRGGLNTDITAFADGSLIVADNTGGDVNELAIGTNGNVLIVNTGAPAWGQVNLADGVNTVTGVLAEANGGTGESAYAQGDILVSDAPNSLVRLPLGTASQVLQSDGTDIIWGPTPPTSGAVMTIEADITFGGGATQAIGDIPAGGRVIKTTVAVGTAWDATETVEIGDAGDTDRLMQAAWNDPEEAILFSTDNNHLYAALTTVNATVTSATATAGAARVIIQYIYP